MYPEDFYTFSLIGSESHEQNTFEFTLLENLIAFSKANNLHDLKHKARKLRDKFKQVAQNGGLSGKHFPFNFSIINPLSNKSLL